MIEIPHPSDLPGQSLERSPDVLLAKQSPEVQKIIADDLRLKYNLQKITNLEDFFASLEASKDIFTKDDNPEPKKKYLKSIIAGSFDYDAVASNGEDFSSIKDLDTARQKVKEGKWTEDDYDNFLDYRDTIKKQAAIKDAARIDGKKQAAIKDAVRIDGKKQAAIEDAVRIDGKKEATTETNTFKSYIEKNHEKLKSALGIADKALTEDGRAFIDQQTLQAKADLSNPAVDTLIQSGISQEDIRNTTKYDGFIRASLLLGASEKEEFQKYITDSSSFESSMREIRSMNIVPSKVDIGKIDKHIDDRFPKTESTSLAKEEIRRSLSVGEVGTIYYDGKGEKYTIMSPDGSSSKEIYMDPPRVSIVRNGLRITRDLIPSTKEEREYKKERASFEGSLKGYLERSKKEPFIAAMYLDDRIIEEAKKGEMKKPELLNLYQGAKSDMNTAFDTSKKAENIGDISGSLTQNREGLRQKGLALFHLQGYLRANGNESEANSVRDGMKVIETTLKENEDQMKKYIEISKKEKIIRNTSTDGASIDKSNKANLDWLIENRFDKLGTSANEILSRIIDALNHTRNQGNKIRLEGVELSAIDKGTLIATLERIGGTPDALTNVEKLTLLRSKLEASLGYNQNHPNSLENMIK